MSQVAVDAFDKDEAPSRLPLILSKSISIFKNVGISFTSAKIFTEESADLSDLENKDQISDDEDKAVTSLKQEVKEEDTFQEDDIKYRRIRNFEIELQLLRKEAYLSGRSLFEYDTHSMLFVTSNASPDLDIRKAIPKYNGQYCFVCGQQNGELIRCCENKCLSRYHSKCIDNEFMGEYHPHLKSKISCPRHHCTTCFAENNRTTAFQYMPEEKFYYCVLCTNAYHQRCFPAGCPRKGFKMICNQHIRQEIGNCSGMPYCFGCRKMFDENPQDPSETCKTCPRSFHATCSRVNMRNDGLCFYCVNKWSPRKGQLCHVFIKNKFYPAQVATLDYNMAINLKGEVPVFLFSNYTRTPKDLKLIPRCHIAPMIQFEPIEIYNEKHPDYGIFKEKYEAAVEMLPFAHKNLLPTTNRISKVPKLLDDMKNRIPAVLKVQMIQPVDAEVCHCKSVNGLKCVDDTCINRYSGNECNEDCGEGCINGPDSRKVSKSVEVVAVPFGGFGLQAKETILKGQPIGEYTGTIIDKDKTEELLKKHELQRNQESPLYIMHICGSLHINSNPSGNATRFANHSCNPNAKITLVMGTDQLPHQMLIAKQQIEAGEQITFDYGHTWSRFNPRCYCGSELCSGHLSGKLKRTILKEKKAKPVAPSKSSSTIKVAKQQPKKRKNDEDSDFVAKYKKTEVGSESPNV